SNEYVLTQFADWLARERDVVHLERVTTTDCRRYAQWLRRRTRDGDDDLSAASAAADGPYFTIVRAFFEWCVTDERLEANPAKSNRVKEALPQTHGTRERQFWSVEDRAALLSYVDSRVERAESGTKRLEKALRDRAIVFVLALSGVRGAEIFREPSDDDRPGLRWKDVDFDRGLVRVLGKSRTYEWASLPTEALSRLERHRTVQSPPTDEWAVFPTYHAPTLSSHARHVLRRRGWEESTIEDALEQHTTTAVLNSNEISPPNISTSGVRHLMSALCNQADIDIDGEYLKPHGARRGLGNQLYTQGSAELAQEVLRHKSIETTHAAYRDEQASETRREVERILDTDAGPDRT
ncbi:MAG: tyrosine-type recombinase/integrase, partial [Halobacteriota archaeon]